MGVFIPYASFFLLSGAVLALKKVPFTDFDDFVRSKIKRLILPFLFTGIFYMIPVKMVGDFYLNRSLGEAICGFIQGAELGHLWFLPALFWCMFVFGTVYLILDKLNIKGIYVMWALSLVVQLTYTYLPFDILQLKTGLSYFFWFTSGYVFEKERQKIEYFDFRKLLFLTPVILWIEYHYLDLGTYSRIIFGSSLVFIIAAYCNKFLKCLVGTKLWHINIDNLLFIS